MIQCLIEIVERELMREIDPDDLKQCWREGYAAYLDQILRDANPYCATNQSQQRDSWQQGWYDAAWDD